MDDLTDIQENEKDVTFDGLNKWFQNMIEKIGWLLTSTAYDNQKFKNFIYGFDRLSAMIKARATELNDVDRKRDTDIMLKKIGKAKKVLKICMADESLKMEGGKRRSSRKNSRKKNTKKK